MHDDGHVRPDRCRAAERPSLREMGVHDGGPPPPHQRPQLGVGTQVIAGPQRSRERRQVGGGRGRRGARCSPPADPTTPHASRVSNPRVRSSSVRNTACRAGPPTLSRVMTRNTRGDDDTCMVRTSTRRPGRAAMPGIGYIGRLQAGPAHRCRRLPIHGLPDHRRRRLHRIAPRRRALLARGDRVVALDDVSTGSIDNVRHLLDHPGFDACARAPCSMRRWSHVLAGRADVVVHLAAAVGVKLIVRAAASLAHHQHPGHRDTCSRPPRSPRPACSSPRRRRSTARTRPARLPETSDRILGSPFVARWSYSEAKAVDEILAHAYWKERGTEAIVVRFFNCVGPARPAPTAWWCRRSCARRSSATTSPCYGTGEQRRCFCHVLDTVGGHHRAARPPRQSGRPVQHRRRQRGLDRRAGRR